MKSINHKKTSGKALFFLTTLFIVLCAQPLNSKEAASVNKELAKNIESKDIRKALIQMAEEDQNIRKKIMEYTNLGNPIPNSEIEKSKAIEKESTNLLKKLIKESGFPTKKHIGEDGVKAAFLLIQHSSDRGFQEQILPVLIDSYKRNSGISGQEIALLTDRIEINKGNKQVYGTQYIINSSGQISFKPIKNEDEVDELRENLGMPPLAVYRMVLEEMHEIQDHPELDISN